MKIYSPRTKKQNISIRPVFSDKFESWLRKQSQSLKARVNSASFSGKAGQVLFDFDKSGFLKNIYIILNKPVSLLDSSKLVDAIIKECDPDWIEKTTFTLEEQSLDKDDIKKFTIGWGLACYCFDQYKDCKKNWPVLKWPKEADKSYIESTVESVFLVRDLVNRSANDLGPAELEQAIKDIAKEQKATVKVITGEKLLHENFPLIYTVGQASPKDRAPRLIDLSWGKKTDPKITLVGKGVCFDTGGLNLKPTAYMALMKKDMGGAAHALALANMIMTMDLPVRLRLLIPAVENAVSGNAFRPGDVLQSRKGLTVENKNTDAEGRLILADALTAASEENPDLIIDFATLTGSARAALGPDIPALFSNNEDIGPDIQKISIQEEDPVWPMPLWKEYKKHIESPIADLNNSAALPGDLIYSALFLQEFLNNEPNWIHIDCYAWEQTGKPGRPRGAADTGFRTIYAFLEKQYRK